MKGSGNSIVWRLLRRNISVAQLGGYALANLVGLAIVITAMQLYGDISAAWNGDDSFMSRDYIVISHKVEGLGSLSGGASVFDPEEISELKSQPWVRRVGEFTAATYNVTASVDMGGAGLSTALFFESIPDDFFDVIPSGWTFDPAHPEVPIVLSKDYLSLYNFGFASSRGLPQLSEAMIGAIPLRVSVSGNGRQEWLPARIAGFSSRLNTVAVPEEFMTWANARFGDSSEPAPSRLIVEVNSPGEPAIRDYLKAHGYEAGGDRGDNDKIAYFMRVMAGSVIAVGAVISLLSLFILLLSVSLLLQKSRNTLHSLMQLGYSPGDVSRYYLSIIYAVNGIVLAVAVVAMLVARFQWMPRLDKLGMSGVSPFAAIMTGIVITVVITLINTVAVKRAMYRYFRR